jgi:exonuclease SbcD
MKLLHTADIHLGFKTYGRRDAETGLNTRLLDVQRSFEFLVERALEAEIDAFLFCGDAYHTADPTPTQQKIFAQCLQPVADAGIPIILVIGNHDHPVTFGRASSLDIFEYLDGDVHFYRKPESKVQVIDTPSGPLQLIPLPWPIRSQILTKDEYRKMKPDELRQFIEEQYVDYVQRRAEDVLEGRTGRGRDGEAVELSPDVPTVMAGHVTVQGSAMAGSERTSLISSEPKFTVGQLAVRPIDYVALGHIHQPQNRNPGGHPPVVYAGSIERVTFKERKERKGFYLVDVDPARRSAGTAPSEPSLAPSDEEPSSEEQSGEEVLEMERGSDVTRLEFVETPARPFVAVHVDARDAEEPTERILEGLEGLDVAGAIVRVRYHVDESQISLVDTGRIRDALEGADKIAAIERTVDPAERKRRTVVTRESDLEDAMRQYVGQHDELSDLEDDLVDAALDLQNELESERRDE